jgi:hypothetical protein
MWWMILLILALLLQPSKESFEVNIKADMPSLNMDLSSVVEGIQNYTTRPLYKKVNSIIPYKHVYRKFKRNIF